jgi:hypothetical protein
MENSMLNNILSTGQIFVPYNEKIADITHADTILHTLELANAAGTGAIAGETRKIVSVEIGADRIAGNGSFRMYPNEGARILNINTGTAYHHIVIIANATNRLQYSLSVTNDDWDVYCVGYVVEA